MKNLLILFLLLSSVVNSQTLKYEITSNKTHIGNMSTTKTEKNGITQIEVISNIKVKLLFTVQLKYVINSFYENNELLFSSATAYVNGKLHTSSVTKKEGNHYTVVKDGHTTNYYNKITYSGVMLYFSPPKDVGHVYSEFDNVDNKMKSIGKNEYQMTNSENGYVNDYLYKDNVLQIAKIHQSLLTFVITKI